MKFLVVGAGAVGGFLAARLAEVAEDVTVLLRPTRVARLRDGGLRVASGDESRVLWPSAVTADELTPGYDAIVLAVKSQVLEGAMADIEPAVKPPAVVVPFLNGIAHIERLVGRFGSSVLGGVLRIATTLDDDGTIRVLTPTFDLEVGELDGSRSDRVSHSHRPSGALGQPPRCPRTSSTRCGPSGYSSPASER